MSDYGIDDIKARKILNSRGDWTIEVKLVTGGGITSIASVPSGASTGKWEAESVDAQTAVKNVNEILGPELIKTEIDIRQQSDIDYALLKIEEKWENKLEKKAYGPKYALGANSILGISIASAKAASKATNVPLYQYISKKDEYFLPTPVMNLVNGGVHAGNNLNVQEFWICPVGADTFSQAIDISTEIYHELRGIVTQKYGRTAKNIGDEGGYTPAIKAPQTCRGKELLDHQIREILEALICAIEISGFEYGPKGVELGMDVAASEFYSAKIGKYLINGAEITGDDLIDMYNELIKEYKITVIEDPFHEDDFESFAKLTQANKDKLCIIGDDLFVTNIKRLQRGIENHAANGLIVKVNQIGSITETLDTVNLAHANGYDTIVSHRSGETNDDFIADLAVGVGAWGIKTGAPARGERVAKYNRLLEIEDELGPKARYRGLPSRIANGR